MVAWQSMNIMQGRILFKFQDLLERQLGSRSYHGLFGDLGKNYSRVIVAGDKEKKPIGGEGEIFPCCPFKGLTLSNVCHHTRHSLSS
jgi:hypothetical protein